MISGSILAERARINPEALALVYVPTGERFTYAALHEHSLRFSHLWLDRLGLKHSDRVGILSGNSPQYVAAFYAAGLSGVALVLLNSRLTAHELAGIVNDAGLSALMYEEQYAATARDLRGLVAVRHWLALDGPHSIPYAELSTAPLPESCRSAPEDTYCLLYTSGTTGQPKGVILPHRMILWNAYNTAASWQLRDSDVSSIFTPLCHAGGVSVFLTSIMLLGGTIVLHRGFDGAEVWRTIEREGVTVVMGVPTIYKMLLEEPSFAGVNTARVRWFISGGAPLPQYIIDAYQQRGITFKQGYGLTEVGVNCFAMSEADSRYKAGSIGTPMMFTEARLLDAEGRELGAGESGELCLRGLHVCRGYWNNPEATAAALDADGWFHTGDQARRDADGFYYIAGRSKDVFISGGVNVYPAEVEAELLTHPAVRDAAVIGVPHAKWGEVGAAFVVLNPGPELGARELSEYLAGRVAKFKVPQQFFFVGSLPRTPYGKVVKAELRSFYDQDRQSSKP